MYASVATYTNSMLGYIQNKLAIAYRTRLTEAALGQYLGTDDADDAKVYYKLSTPFGSSCAFHVLSRFQLIWTTGSRIPISASSVLAHDALSISDLELCLSRMITVDINRFATSLAAIYGNVAKPGEPKARKGPGF